METKKENIKVNIFGFLHSSHYSTEPALVSSFGLCEDHLDLHKMKVGALLNALDHIHNILVSKPGFLDQISFTVLWCFALFSVDLMCRCLLRHVFHEVPVGVATFLLILWYLHSEHKLVFVLFWLRLMFCRKPRVDASSQFKRHICDETNWIKEEWLPFELNFKK